MAYHFPELRHYCTMCSLSVIGSGEYSSVKFEMQRFPSTKINASMFAGVAGQLRIWKCIFIWTSSCFHFRWHRTVTSYLRPFKFWGIYTRLLISIQWTVQLATYEKSRTYNCRRHHLPLPKVVYHSLRSVNHGHLRKDLTFSDVRSAVYHHNEMSHNIDKHTLNKTRPVTIRPW